MNSEVRRLPLHALSFLVMVALVGACRGEPEPSPDEPAAAPDTTVRAPPTPARDAGASPEEASASPSPGRDAAEPAPSGLSGLAAAVLRQCQWRRVGFELSCPAYQQWLRRLDAGDADAALVELLQADEAHARWLAAAGLIRRGAGYRADRGLADRVVAAAERERDRWVAKELGACVARLELKKTGMVERARALVTKHPVDGLRAALIGELLHQGGAAYFDLTRQLALEDASQQVRLAALSAFWVGGSERAAEVCQLWRDHIGSEELPVSEKASYLLSSWGRCRAHFEPLQAEQEKRAAGGRMTWAWFSSVEFVMRDDKLGRSERKRALAIARTTVEQLGNGYAARNRALDFLLQHDRKNAPAFAERYLEDPEALVRAKARKIVNASR